MHKSEFSPNFRTVKAWLLGEKGNNFFKLKFCRNNVVGTRMDNKIPLFVMYNDNKHSTDYA
jgi:hypothetical protein